LLLLTFLWILPAALTSDVGLALLNIPVTLILLFAIDRRNRIVHALIGLTLLFVAGAPLARVFLPVVASEEMLLSLASDSNYARFLHFAAPEQLQQLATKRGESLAITSAILQRYISTGLFGVGYGHTDVSPHLGDTALRDFAPAVFIAAEWGLVGTLAMLLLYALIGYVAFRIMPLGATRIGTATRSSSAAMMAAIGGVTIAVASVYMILANHELVLLTGKNAYLFGLDSAGDILETLGLLLVIAYGAAAVRDANDLAPGGLR
jgi:cell division protein FtsW (lipid II flippase)